MQYPVSLCGRVILVCSSHSTPFVIFDFLPQSWHPSNVFCLIVPVRFKTLLYMEENLQTKVFVLFVHRQKFFWTKLVRSIWLININLQDKYIWNHWFKLIQNWIMCIKVTMLESITSLYPELMYIEVTALESITKAYANFYWIFIHIFDIIYQAYNVVDISVGIQPL